MAIKVYGLTGGIAAGKSTVAGIFKKYGIPVIDADQLSRELNQPGSPAYPEILKRFGTTDRKALRQIVFSDPKALDDLQAILHPLILNRSMESFKNLEAHGHPVCLYEAALLVETGRHEDLDGLIVVTAPLAKRIERFSKRDGSDPEQAKKIMASQLDDSTRIQHAQFVISNDGDLAHLENEVRRVLLTLRPEALRHRPSTS